MGRQPAFQFYPGDWLRDIGVQAAPFETRGIWMELLMRMWDAEPRGCLSMSKDDYCRLISCTKLEWNHALKNIEVLKIAEVSRNDNGDITIINRRMFREQKEREQGAERQRRHRDKQKYHAGYNGDITAPSSSSSSSSKNNSNVTCDNSVTDDLTIIYQFWQGAMGVMGPSDASNLRDCLSLLQRTIGDRDDLQTPVEIICAEIGMLTHKPESKRTTAYLYGTIRGKANELGEAT